MKVKSSIKKICNKCKQIRRYKKNLIVCKIKKHKQRQG
ncbi:50S ribosomal protein L36 [Candidatus Vidania fulgoroideae]|nr:50S ribosomal protein L36 [Candidatus Vidania fulgoroideae]